MTRLFLILFLIITAGGDDPISGSICSVDQCSLIVQPVCDQTTGTTYRNICVYTMTVCLVDNQNGSQSIDIVEGRCPTEPSTTKPTTKPTTRPTTRPTTTASTTAKSTPTTFPTRTVFPVTRKVQAGQTSFPTRSTSAECQPSWDDVMAGGSSGGIHVWPKNVFDCMRECELVGSCVGVDYDTANNCYLHQNDTAMKTQFTATQHVKQHRIKRCPSTVIGCVDGWTTVRRGRSLMATQVTGSTIQECRSRCESIATCNGIDFEEFNKPYACWLHQNRAAMETTFSFVNSMFQYRYKRCQDCYNVWDGLPHREAAGGVLKADIRDKNSCMDECVTSLQTASGCYAINYENTAKRCYLYYNHQNIATTYSSTKDTYHYVLRQRCITTAEKLLHRVTI